MLNKKTYLDLIENILNFGTQNKCSDIHINSSSRPAFRIDGDIVETNNFDVLTPEQVSSIIVSILSDIQKKIYQEKRDLDFAFQTDSGLRFRVNAYDTLEGPAMAFREIPMDIPGFDDLNLPESVRNLAHVKSGLILVVGPTGSGKSTTISSIIDHINHIYPSHIITIEDPIEFIHQNKKSIVNQREVRTHTRSFPAALKSALREDPDIILVGEMRDPETMELAITAAETGHLVFATLHTNSASQTIHRVVNSFPDGDKDSVRSSLSASLKAVVSQRLFKRDGGGRCAAFEVMIANNGIRNLIREDNVAQLDSTIEIGKRSGMILMKESINNLAAKGLISQEVASNASLAIE